MPQTDFDNLTYQELRQLCKHAGLDASGSRAVLEDRLSEHLKTSGDDITMNNVNEEEEESASEEEDGDQEDQEDEDVDEEAEQALQEAVEMQDVTADANDQDDENEDNSDDDADPSKPELLGVLIRTPDAKTGEDDGDNDDGIVFVGVDALKDAFEDALSEIQQEQESGTDDDDDIDLEEAEWEPPKTKADGLATRVATGLSIIEFVIMLYVLAMDKVPVELLKEPPGQAVFDAFLLRAGTSQFWMEFGIYCFLFFLLPIVVGLLFGKHNTPESVLGYALSRAALAYMLPANLSTFGAQQRVLNTTAAVSIVLAFWEKQSAYADF